MLKSKLFASVRDLARTEKINEAYLGRVLRLTLLSPSITEAILSGQQREALELADLLKPFPIEWKKQGALFLGISRATALGMRREHSASPPASAFAIRVLSNPP